MSCKTNEEIGCKYILEYISIVPVIGAIIWALVKGGGYMYMKGVYHYWNIPDDYIVINSGDVLFRFIVIIGLSVITCIVSVVIAQCCENHGTSLLKKLIVLLLLVGTIAVLLFGILCYMCSFQEVFLYVLNYPFKFWGTVIILSILCFACFWGIGNLVMSLLDRVKNNSDVNKERSFKSNTIVVLFTVFYTFALMFIMFDIGKKITAETKDFTIVTIEEEKYIIINTYKDKWIVKQCIDTEDGRKIDNVHYMICDLDGYPLEVWKLEAGDSINNHILNLKQQYAENIIDKNNEVGTIMDDIIMMCNENEGFVAAILSVLALIISVIAMYMSYQVGKMPFKKNVRIIPTVYKEGEEWYIDLLLINSGHATICIRTINIYNNKNLNIGMLREDELIVLKPCEYTRKKINLYDDLENIEKNQNDLNGHIIIIAYDVDNKIYKFTKGFGVG